MCGEIIGAICRKLDAQYGDAVTLYAEDIHQGLQIPCFFVRSVSVATQQFTGSGKRLLRPFDIQYFPALETAPKREISEVLEALPGCLEYVELSDGSLLRGTGMSWEVVDDVGHFLVSYNHMTRGTAPAAEHMAELEVRPHPKGD